MNHRRGSSPIYKGYGDSLKGVDPSMSHCRWYTPIKKAGMNH